jgi:hypothetical protein
MTRAELAALTARVDWVKRIIQAIKEFDRCRTESDFTRAERDLQAALNSVPTEQVDKLGY